MNHVQYDLRKKLVLAAQDTFKIVQVLIMSHAPSLLMSYTVMRLEVLRPLQPVTNKQINAKLVKWLDLPRSKNSKQSLHHPIQGVVLKLKNWKGPNAKQQSQQSDCSHGPLFDSPCEELEAALSQRKSFVSAGFWLHGKVVKRVAFDYSKFKEVTPSKGRGAIYALLIPRRFFCLGFAHIRRRCFVETWAEQK